MEVCKECHKNDSEATGCGKNFDEHYPYSHKKILAECMICGKKKYLCLCPSYGGYNVRDTRERKSKKRKK